MARDDHKTRRLTAKQGLAVQTILTAATMDEAAKEAGTTRSTLYRWLKDDLFFQELSRAKRRMIDHHLLRLQRTTGSAIDTLNEICRDKDAPASARVAAAKAVLDSVMKAIEIEVLAAVMNKLKEAGLLGKNITPGF